MNATLPLLAAVFLGGLFLSAFFSMVEAAVISQDKHRLRHRADSGDRPAIVMQALLTDKTDKLLATILLCNNLANVSCAISATAIVTRLLGNDDSLLLAVTFSVTFILLLFSEITPKAIGVRYALPIALSSARPLNALLWLLSPIIFITNWLAYGLMALFRVRQHANLYTVMNITELRAAVRASAGDNRDEENSRHYNMLEKALLFRELPVEKIMTPRPDIKGINLKQSDRDIAEQIRRATATKIPVYEDNIDACKGVVDTLQAVKKIRDDALPAERLLADAVPVHFVPAAAAAMQQLQAMRRQKRRLALALDGSGRVVGLLTFANFAAAIIGDEDIQPAEWQTDGSMEVQADMTLIHLEHMEPRFSIPTTTATTINGMILEYLGDLPDNPLCLNIHGLRMEITEFDDRSIRRVRLFAPLTDN